MVYSETSHLCAYIFVLKGYQLYAWVSKKEEPFKFKLGITL